MSWAGIPGDVPLAANSNRPPAGRPHEGYRFGAAVKPACKALGPIELYMRHRDEHRRPWLVLSPRTGRCDPLPRTRFSVSIWNGDDAAPGLRRS
jgi:hypothetical protein